MNTSEMKSLVEKWFSTWEKGEYEHLPIAEHFEHVSPFGTLTGKEVYLQLVRENEDKFLGYHFERHDAIYSENRACVRYTGTQGDFKLDVSEWYYASDHLIDQIIAYYHIGEIRPDRLLQSS